MFTVTIAFGQVDGLEREMSQTNANFQTIINDYVFFLEEVRQKKGTGIVELVKESKFAQTKTNLQLFG